MPIHLDKYYEEYIFLENNAVLQRSIMSNAWLNLLYCVYNSSQNSFHYSFFG